MMKEFTGELRKDMIRVPEAIYQARGILVFGKRMSASSAISMQTP